MDLCALYLNVFYLTFLQETFQLLGCQHFVWQQILCRHQFRLLLVVMVTAQSLKADMCSNISKRTLSRSPIQLRYFARVTAFQPLNTRTFPICHVLSGRLSKEDFEHFRGCRLMIWSFKTTKIKSLFWRVCQTNLTNHSFLISNLKGTY